MTKPKTLQQAIQHFSDEQVCIDTFAAMRWPNGVECVACGHKEHYYLKTQKRWKCKDCGKQFSVKVGSIFEDSAIPMNKWLTAMWMICNCKNGVSSYEIHRTIGVTQKSAWFMMHRLRLALAKNPWDHSKIGGGSGSEVEADETFIGGKLRNMHTEKKIRYIKRGGAHGKAAVLGMLDRETRQVRAKVVPNVKRETLQAEVLSAVKHGSTVYTDEYLGYDKLHYRFVHDVVNHTQQYVKGRVHTNGIENFWSLLKRGLNGTYVAVEPYHLNRYVDEQVFRFNNRKDGKRIITDAERFELALSQAAGRRLTFAEVTGKVGATPN